MNSSGFIKNIVNKNRMLRSIKNRIKTYIEPDAKYIIKRYENRFHRKFNMNSPKTFNEKITYLMINELHKPIYTKLADKYRVRKYAIELIGKKYLTEFYGVYKKWHHINFSKLPKQFVIKVNHNSGGVYIVRDKNKFLDSENIGATNDTTNGSYSGTNTPTNEYKRVEKKFKEWLKENFYYSGREKQYKKIKPRIIIEEYLGDTVEELRVWTFNGRVKYISTTVFDEDDMKNSNGKKTILQRGFYNTEWKLDNFSMGYSAETKARKRPEYLETIIKLSEKLVKGLKHCRVDFYVTDEGRVVLGEMTFSHSKGHQKFIPESADLMFGKLLNLDI